MESIRDRPAYLSHTQDFLRMDSVNVSLMDEFKRADQQLSFRENVRLKEKFGKRLDDLCQRLERESARMERLFPELTESSRVRPSNRYNYNRGR